MKLIVAFSALLWFTAAALPVRGDNSSNLPFQVGEKLTYQIYWGPFVGGRAVIQVQGIETNSGHECYHLVLNITTSGLADMLYPVRSTFESWLDVNELCARRGVMNRSEGKRIHRTDTSYDYDNKTAITTNLLNGKVRTLTLAPATQDPISSFYYARCQSLSLSNSFSFPINTGTTNVTCTLMPDQRKQYSLPAVGKVPALRIEPEPTLTIVAKNGGRMWFWVSDDARKVPLFVVSTLKFGSLKLVLNKIENITTPASGPHTAASGTILTFNQ
jgi:hypothetical protein